MNLIAPSSRHNPTEKLAMNTLKLLALSLCLALVSPLYAEGDDHDGEGSDVIVLSAGEQRGAGIVVAPITERSLSEIVRVPGEVRINAYRSTRVTPRITAQVVARHVRLGEDVTIGLPLVTLSSVEMAAAQGALIVADKEWERVKSLGRQTVSERRFYEAQVAQQQALAAVIAYGMTAAQAASLVKAGDASKATGAFDLLAPQDGTVLRDSFIVGELIEPGRVLFDISDESVIWVEAQIVQSAAMNVEYGSEARVSLDGKSWITGRLIQRNHQLDETTRTRGLRIEVENADDRLHPGQFVEVELSTVKSAPTLAIPRAAVIMIEGATTVFKRDGDDQFHPEAIDIGPTVGDWIEVRSGLAVGDIVAITNVFHLKSLLLKSSLGEGHGH
ncbi:MAG: efflux RND transporter periplasmic adaptor subunit [Pseudomonadota bacterium]|jgi:cobalt-zinc-cadmium efflux system membrane fusion protein